MINPKNIKEFYSRFAKVIFELKYADFMQRYSYIDPNLAEYI